MEAIKPYARPKQEKNSHRVHLLIYQGIEMSSVFKEQQIVISAIQAKTLSCSQNFPFRRSEKGINTYLYNVREACYILCMLEMFSYVLK